LNKSAFDPGGRMPALYVRPAVDGLQQIATLEAVVESSEGGNGSVRTFYTSRLPLPIYVGAGFPTTILLFLNIRVRMEIANK
jgi:hypothetical protein